MLFRSGEDISYISRLMAVCDVFDALTSQRYYKEGWSLEDTYNEIVRQSGTQFDPDVVKLFIDNFDKFKQIHNEVYEEVTPNYIALRNEKGKNICEVHIYKSRILIITRELKNKELLIGEKVPEKYLWSLNYRVYFENEHEIDKIIEILGDVYNQIK